MRGAGCRGRCWGEMKAALTSSSVGGPKRLLTTVGFSTPFALRYRRARLSSSKPSCRMPQGLRYLSPNGTLLSVRPEPVEGQAELVFPIALSLSKGAFAPQDKGFDKLSPNGTLLSVRPEPVEGQAELVFPIALSLSKGAFAPQDKGFDKLSPNGEEAGLPSIPQDGRNSHLSPNGSLRTLKFAKGPQANARRSHRGSQPTRWSH